MMIIPLARWVLINSSETRKYDDFRRCLFDDLKISEIMTDEKIAIRRKVKDAFKEKMPLILCDLLDSSNGEKKMVDRHSVHTLGTSVANGNKSTKKKPSIGQQIAIDKKYNLLTSRKYFTSSLAVQISAYEKERMENGEEVSITEFDINKKILDFGDLSKLKVYLKEREYDEDENVKNRENSFITKYLEYIYKKS